MSEEKHARKKRASKKIDDPALIAKLPFDNYVMVEMKRSDLASAPYNPRIMGDQEKARLKLILGRHGMVQPPTWNKRSAEKGWPAGSQGVIVGGHQRLSQLDSLHGSTNYTLQVAVIDVEDTAEKNKT